MHKVKVTCSTVGIPSATFIFLKLRSYNYSLPALIKRRNRGVILFFLHSFHRYLLGKILGPGSRESNFWIFSAQLGIEYGLELSILHSYKNRLVPLFYQAVHIVSSAKTNLFDQTGR